MQREQGSVQPEWTAVIPTFESSSIFYDGLPNLPKHRDLIVAHTTIYDGGFMHEDNRLCAINCKSGEVAWYFPSDLNNRKCCYFDDIGYSYKNKLVFQYSTQHLLDMDSSFDMRKCRSTVCLDAETGQVLWEKETVTNNVASSKTVVGQEEIVFFVQDSSKVVRANINDNTFVDFFVDDSLSVNDMNLSDGLLTLFCWKRYDLYDYSIYVVVLDSKTGGTVLPPTFLYNSSILSHGIIAGGILYVNVDRNLYAIDIKTGQRIWERNDEWTYGLEDLFVYGNVLLKCSVNATTGYDKNTGKIIYNYDDYGSWHTSVHGGYAYLLNLNDILDIIDISTGKKLGYIKCPQKDGFLGSYPMIYDNKLYIMGGNNYLFRYPTYPWKN